MNNITRPRNRGKEGVFGGEFGRTFSCIFIKNTIEKHPGNFMVLGVPVPLLFGYFRNIRFVLSGTFRTYLNIGSHSHSTGVNRICLGIIICPICSPFGYLIYPYYPAYHRFCYHFVINGDNRIMTLSDNFVYIIPYYLSLFKSPEKKGVADILIPFPISIIVFYVSLRSSISSKLFLYDKSPAASPAGLLPGGGAHEITGRTSE